MSLISPGPGARPLGVAPVSTGTLTHQLDFRTLVHLCGRVCPGQLEFEGFFGDRWLGRTRTKPGGDQDPPKLDEHVEVGRMGLGAIPRGAGTTILDDGRAMTVLGVPDHDDALSHQSERDGPLHRTQGAVAGLTDAGVLTSVFEGDLDRPTGGVTGEDLSGRLCRSVVIRARS